MGTSYILAKYNNISKSRHINQIRKGPTPFNCKTKQISSLPEIQGMSDWCLNLGRKKGGKKEPSNGALALTRTAGSDFPSFFSCFPGNTVYNSDKPEAHAREVAK